MTDLNTSTRQSGDGLPENSDNSDTGTWADFEPKPHAYDAITLEQLFNPPSTYHAMRLERDEAMTRAILLQMERGALKTKVEEQEALIQSLRETLDKVRRELAEARLKLGLASETQNVELNKLTDRVRDLEDVVYPLDQDGQPISRQARRDVFTLVQDFSSASALEEANAEYARKLNEGWVKDHIEVSAVVIGQDILRTRVITLVRDIPDDASGDDDRAEVTLPKADDADSEPAVTPLSPAIIIEPPAVPAPALNEALDHPIVQAIRQNGSDAVIVEANRELLQVAEAAYELRRTHVVRRPPVPTFLLPERI